MTLCARPNCPLGGTYKLANGDVVCAGHFTKAPANQKLEPEGHSERMNTAFRDAEYERQWLANTWRGRIARMFGRGV